MVGSSVESRSPEVRAPSAKIQRVVMVTGASSGIGRSVVLQLAQPGTALVLAARSREPLDDVAYQCRARGARALVAPTDVGEAEQVEALFASAREEFGRVDAVTHGAAVLAYGRFEDVPAEVWDGVIKTTLMGSANVARAALHQFDRQGGRGRLVVVSSVVGKIAVPWMSSYVTAKWALQGLIRTLQIEARSTPGVQISLVTPGSVDTPTYRKAAAYGDRRGSPPPPVIDPDTAARAVVGCLQKARRDKSVGILNPVLVTGFRVLPGLYDRWVIPLMSRNGLQSNDAQDDAGNVLSATGPADLRESA